MNIQIGSQTFMNVKIPLLWGERAVIGHVSGALSIIYLGEASASPEVVGDQPAIGVDFSERDEGFVILKDEKEAYFYSPNKKLLRDLSGTLPECVITARGIRVGSSTFEGNVVSGFAVGIGVTEKGFFMGGPIPEGLAPLLI